MSEMLSPDRSMLMSHRQGSVKAHTIRPRTEHRSVLILYTGGTMGMRPLDDGSLAPVKGYLTDRIHEMPEMNLPNMPKYEIKEYDPLLDSSCMGPKNWSQIADDLEENYHHYDGFVVIMGTDTMAYASSALSFMMENLGKTVVFTGSQIPFCEVYNDARRNLIVSILFAANSDIPEVCLCFNDKLLRANRTMKVNSMSLDAFDSPNFPPLATLGATVHENRELILADPTKELIVHKNLDANIIVIKLFPGCQEESIMALAVHSKNLKAIVLELYGTGNGPSNQSMLDALNVAKDRNIIIVALSQCLKGGVSLDTYSMGRDFKNAGVIAGGDMTTEACTTKLAYLFGLYDSAKVAMLLAENIRGEITPPKHKANKYFHRGQVEKTPSEGVL